MNDILWRILSRLFLPFFDKPLSVATSHEATLCVDLKEKCRQYPPFDTKDLQPSEAAWIGYMNSLRELVLSQDPRGFLRWPPVVLMMSPTRVSFFVKELQYLKSRPDWRTRWSKAIRESPTGHPLPYLLHPASSGNLIRHAYYLAKFEEKTGLRINEMNFVFEFGGGYGCMCRLFHSLGFRGKYVIFDLPLFAYLQEYYLQSVGLEVHSIANFQRTRTGVTCISDFEQLKKSLSDHGAGNRTMFVATESFSEIPIDQRDKFLPLVLGFESFLITFSNLYREANNVEYFGKWIEHFGNHVRWYRWQNERMPGYSYLAGETLTERS